MIYSVAREGQKTQNSTAFQLHHSLVALHTT